MAPNQHPKSTPTRQYPKQKPNPYLYPTFEHHLHTLSYPQPPNVIYNPNLTKQRPSVQKLKKQRSHWISDSPSVILICYKSPEFGADPLLIAQLKSIQFSVRCIYDEMMIVA